MGRLKSLEVLKKWADTEVGEMPDADLREYGKALRRLVGKRQLKWKIARARMVEVEQEIQRR